MTQDQARLLGGVSILTGALDAGVYGLTQLFSSTGRAPSGGSSAVTAGLLALERPMQLAAALLPVAAVALCIVGVGLLLGRSWAARASRLWAVGALLVLVAGVGIHLVAIRPRVLQLRAEAAAASEPQATLTQLDLVSNSAFRVAAIRLPLPVIFLLLGRRRQRSEGA
jgi:cytochrome c biogenesis factor